MIGLGIGLAVTVAAVTAGAVEVVRRWALRQSVVDVPNGRSSHTVPTPRGGGLAVVGVTAAGAALALALGVRGALPGLLVSAAAVAVVSAVDDVRPLRPRTRFAAHGLAAVLAVGAFGPWTALAVPFVGTVSVGPVVGGALSVVWLVGLTNAYNFMDGIDGIAGAQAVVAGAAWAAVGSTAGMPSVALVGGVVAASAVGFLVHNWSPARIFMGDVGSATLGFVFAALGLAASDLAAGAVGRRAPLGALLFVWPFVFDAALTFVRRLRAGEDVFAAHRSHLYQRMVIAGWTHRRVATLYATLAATSAAAGAAWVLTGSEWAVVAGLVAPVSGALRATAAAERSGGQA